MKLWRKKVWRAGWLFVAGFVVFWITNIAGLLDWMSSILYFSIPFICNILAAICFAIYVGTTPSERDITGGNIVAAIVTLVIGGIPAFFWYGMWFIN